MTRTAVAAPAQPPDPDAILEQVSSLPLQELLRLRELLDVLLRQRRREAQQQKRDERRGTLGASQS